MRRGCITVFGDKAPRVSEGMKSAIIPVLTHGASSSTLTLTFP